MAIQFASPGGSWNITVGSVRYFCRCSCDDLGFAVVEEGSTTPTIDTDVSSTFFTIEEGSTDKQTFSIGNTGEEDLNFQMVVTYPEPSAKALDKEPAL